MKKILLFIIITFGIALISCNSNTPESKIKESFMAYVQDNFDNPETLKEIVSINLKDTISTLDLKNIINDYINLCNQADHDIDSLLRNK